MNKITLDVVYNISKHNPAGTHIYTQKVEETSLGCPQCRSRTRSLWMDSDPGDYYVGPKFYCPACFWTGHVIESSQANPNGVEADDQILKAVIDAKDA